MILGTSPLYRAKYLHTSTQCTDMRDETQRTHPLRFHYEIKKIALFLKFRVQLRFAGVSVECCVSRNSRKKISVAPDLRELGLLSFVYVCLLSRMFIICSL